MSNKLTVNDELKNYYFIEVGNISDGLDYFLNEDDYYKFISLIGKINGLFAYCLAPSDVKLLFNVSSNKFLVDELSLVINNYCKYFNKKYNDLTKMKDATVNVSDVKSIDELLSVSKRIHTTPETWLHHPYSSIRAYLYDDVPEFLVKSHISNIYGSAVEYFEYLNK